MSTEGTCPLCGSKGEVGTPCQEKACKRRGVHFIPDEYFQKLTEHEGVQIDTLLGQVIDAYLVVDKLGSGGFGKVYLGLQMPIMLEGAIKLLEPQDNQTSADVLVRNFQQEAKSLARLTDPHIVKLQRYGVFRNTPYMVMEYVKNARTLKQEMDVMAQEGRRFSLEQTVHIIHQILSGLKSTHRLQIVHRDIKPDNIMLQRIEDDDFFVRIVDFGLAKFIEARTYTDTILGTPIYMAPEQITKVHIGPWTDLYAVGVIAFEMLTGRKPFKFRTFQELLGQKISPDYDPLDMIADLDPPDGLKNFFSMALARKYEDRYKSVDEFRAGFDSAVTEMKVLDAKTTGLDPLARMLVSRSITREPPQNEQESGRGKNTRDSRAKSTDVSQATGPEGDQDRNQGQESAEQKPEKIDRTLPLESPPVAAGESGGSASTPTANDKRKNKKSGGKTGLFLVITVLLIAGVGVAFFFLRGKNKKHEAPALENTRPQQVQKQVPAPPTPVAAKRAAPVTTSNAGRARPKNPAGHSQKQQKTAAKTRVGAPGGKKGLTSKPTNGPRSKKMQKKRVAQKNMQKQATKGAKKVEKDQKMQKNTKVVKAVPAKASGVKGYERTCKAGDAAACYKLAVLYDEGKKGVKRSKQKAAALYKKACDMGKMGACYNLGRMYQHGEGVARDYKQAARLYKKACNNKLTYGCLGLGLLYVKGKGVGKDYDRASELFKSACDKGSKTGCSLYDRLELIK